MRCSASTRDLYTGMSSSPAIRSTLVSRGMLGSSGNWIGTFFREVSTSLGHSYRLNFERMKVKVVLVITCMILSTSGMGCL